MVAYSLRRIDAISEDTWRGLAELFAAQWRRSRQAAREARKDGSGPDYYVVRLARLSDLGRATRGVAPILWMR